jgi:hypothetical protein
MAAGVRRIQSALSSFICAILICQAEGFVICLFLKVTEAAGMKTKCWKHQKGAEMLGLNVHDAMRLV